MDFSRLGLSGEWFLSGALTLVTALGVLLLGWFLSDFLSHKVVGRLQRSPRVDRTIAPIVGELLRYGILAVTIIAVLGQFGVQTASILAVLGAIGLAIALALQGTLSNMAAGLMLLWLRPFNVGDSIQGEEVTGNVTEIGLFATRLRTYDGIFVFVPNSILWNARIINWSREATRMVEVKVPINYTSSVDQAKTALATILTDERVLPEPAPSIFVSALGEGSVQLCVRMWVKNDDWFHANIDMMERAKEALGAAGVDTARNTLDISFMNALREVQSGGLRQGDGAAPDGKVPPTVSRGDA